MCGIVGIVGASADARVGRAMREALRHRGPDAQGEIAQKNLYLGHRRLRIIDLSPASDQPLSTEDGRYTIVYNGEVYNFRELRRRLEALGERFKTEGDAEVVLRAFSTWRERCVEHFEGMFAFAVWDAWERKLFLFRDRFGVKPLYFWHSGRKFAFASEVGALLQHPRISGLPDGRALATYLLLGYIPAPLSAFEGVKKLLPGGALVFDAESGRVEERLWWSASDFFDQKTAKGEDELADELEELLSVAFERRMVSDVPVGVFLSGGVDSSAVVAVLAQRHPGLKSFCVAFDDPRFDESRYARFVSRRFGTDHHEYICTPRDVEEVLPRLPGIFGEPFGDQSAVPTYLVSRLAREEVGVALSAEGGDELFAGYPRYRLALRWLSVPRVLSRALAAAPAAAAKLPLTLAGVEEPKNKLARAQWLAAAEKPLEIYLASVGYFSQEEVLRLVGARPDLSKTLAEALPDELPAVDFMRLADVCLYLADDILVKTDRATMAASLEGREPFLDVDLFRFAAALPEKALLKGGGKFLLKKVLSKYLPKGFLARPKRGFGMPLDAWLKGPLRRTVLDVLSPERVKATGVVDPEVCSSVLDEWLRRKRPSMLETHRVWLLLVLQLWAEAFGAGGNSVAP